MYADLCYQKGSITLSIDGRQWIVVDTKMSQLILILSKTKTRTLNVWVNNKCSEFLVYELVLMTMLKPVKVMEWLEQLK